MTKTLMTAIFLFSTMHVANAAIYTQLPPGDQRTPTEKVQYDVSPVEGGSVIDIDVGGIFSHNVLGSIPPNETRVVDVATTLGNAGEPYRVVGIGWDVLLDAFVPSWLSDASIALGDDSGFLNPDLLVAPGMGSDFPGFQTFESGGIIDLTNTPVNGDVSFELASGILYLEFFEVFDDFGDGAAPDAIWETGSTISVQVVPVPEPAGVVGFGLICFFALLRQRRRRR